MTHYLNMHMARMAAMVALGPVLDLMVVTSLRAGFLLSVAKNAMHCLVAAEDARSLTGFTPPILFGFPLHRSSPSVASTRFLQTRSHHPLAQFPQRTIGKMGMRRQSRHDVAPEFVMLMDGIKPR
jgi:hypothetical protein